MIRRIKELFELKKYGPLNYTIKDKQEYKEFQEMSDAESWGKKHYKEWAEKYKEIMRIANRVKHMNLSSSPIECYCGYSYQEINNYLRFDIDSECNLYRELSHILTMVLCSAPRIPENIVVYRLVCDEFIEDLIKNNKDSRCTPNHEKGFLSTSLTLSIINS